MRRLRPRVRSPKCVEPSRLLNAPSNSGEFEGLFRCESRLALRRTGKHGLSQGAQHDQGTEEDVDNRHVHVRCAGALVCLDQLGSKPGRLA